MARLLPITEWKKEPKTCNCETCRSMCQVPCIPSPQEAKKLIKLGYGPKLMLDSRYLRYEVAVLAPARKGAEGRARYESSKGCTLQFRGKCTIHTVCKPIEGRLAICKGREPVQLRDRVVKLWDNDSARRLVKSWIKKFALEPEILLDVFRDELTLRDSRAKSAHAKNSTTSCSADNSGSSSRPPCR